MKASGKGSGTMSGGRGGIEDGAGSGHALVTGASGGIGAEFALQLAASGHALILAGRNRGRLESTLGALRGPRAAESLAIPMDLSEQGAASRLHAECAARGLVVDTLVNNAGSGVFGAAVDSDPAAVEAMLRLNVQALASLSALFGRDMKARGRGRILNVGSFAGLQATPYFAAYAASKAFVLDYSLALRAELAGSGVNVSCLLPGYVRTAFDANAGIGSPAYLKFSEANSLDAATVARIGLRALERGKSWTIAGARNRFAAALFSLLPRSFPPRIMRAALERLI